MSVGDSIAGSRPAQTSLARPAIGSESLLAIPAFRLLLVVQVLFWSASAVFLMLPKYLAVQLHAGAFGIGAVMGGLGVGAVAMAPVIAAFNHRWGRRRWLVAANLLMALGSFLFIGVDAPGPLAVLGRCLHGMAGAILYAHGTVLIIDLVPRQRLPSAIALYMTAGLLPNVSSPPLAEWLLATHGPVLVFASAGVLALGGAVLAWWLPDAVARQDDSAPRAAGRPTMPMLVVALVFGLAAGVVFTFHQPLALDRGVQRLSYFLIAFTVTATALRLIGGPWIDRFGSAQVACWSGAGYACVLLAMAAMGPGWLIPLGIAFGATHGLFFPTFIAYALSRSDDRGREVRMAWMSAADKAGYFCVVPLGLIAHRSGYAVLFVVAAFLVAVAVGVLRQARRGEMTVAVDGASALRPAPVVSAAVDGENSGEIAANDGVGLAQQAL